MLASDPAGVVEPVTHRSVAKSSLEGTLRSATVNQLGLVKTIDGLGQALSQESPTADSRLGPLLQPIRSVYLIETTATITMGHGSITASGPAVVQWLLQGIQNKAGMRGPAGPPANDPPRIRVNDKRYIDKADPVAHVKSKARAGSALVRETDESRCAAGDLLNAGLCRAQPGILQAS